MKHHQKKRKRSATTLHPQRRSSIGTTNKGIADDGEQTAIPHRALERFAGSSCDEEEDVEEEYKAGDDDEQEKEKTVKKERTVNTDVNSSHQSESDHQSNDLEKSSEDWEDDTGKWNRPNSDNEDSSDASSLVDDSSMMGVGTNASIPQSSSTGMANAMMRILQGGGRKRNSNTLMPSKEGADTDSGNMARVQRAKQQKPVVLSQTVTPLQKRADEELQLMRRTKEVRRLKRDKHIQAMHIPLSVATTRCMDHSGEGSFDNNGGSIVQELEQERMLRRIATRGVIALFNAIAQHQKGNVGTDVDSADNRKKNSTKSKSKTGANMSMTKESFLNLIKAKAAATKETHPSTKIITKKERSLSTNNTTKSSFLTAAAISNSRDTPSLSKWNAFRDDYLMDSKKNWDLEDNMEKDYDGSDYASVDE